ncbi:hypothetical protein P152DRAFT_108791 [Eremomyces bilateralis CBS 781.70]|uniref:Uncharacterized protein n=1 Tax=Eremomyces bilateralis CBS 781.70 TaxID=1392243 RepID=A0A6G1GDF2_9PEZI|nr:uncharacterized protein P152DRAFT_108791 [Eremomyces bilateralis CBS 781.70]KAF1816044.1 hypothetical protein P152DRAFT_108791 [Eremomyces bilateralis CBS 781.70]
MTYCTDIHLQFSTCFVDRSSMTMKDIRSVMSLAATRLTEAALAYPADCYAKDTSTTPSPCQTFVQQRIDSRINRAPTCPFHEATCEGEAIDLDSGFIDSSTHIGINYPSSQRIKPKKVTTSSVMSVDQQLDLVLRRIRRTPRDGEFP